MSAARPLAPWVRTRLRTSRSAALLLALLVLGTAFLAAALPRTLDRDADRAVTALLSGASPAARSLTARVSSDDVSATGTAYYGTALSDQVARLLQGQLTEPLAPSPDESVYGARTTVPRDLTSPGLPQPDGVPPLMNLVTLDHADKQLRLLSGWLPDAAETAPDGTRRFEIALAKPSADLLGVGVGAVLDTGGNRSVQPMGSGPPTRVQAVVVGIVQPDDPGGGFWSATPCLTGPCLTPCLSGPCTGFTNIPPPFQYWEVDALTGPGMLPGLPAWDSKAELFWQISIDPHHLRGYQLPQAAQLVDSMLDGLPQALVAALVGAGLSCLTVPLLGPSVNLTAMVGTTVPGGLRAAPAAVGWQALLLAALACAVVVAETLLTGRRQITTELRAGDQR